MSTAGLGAPVASRSPADGLAPRSTRVEPLAAAAWLWALPCIAVVALLAAVFGPVLGDLLAADPADYTFFPQFAVAVHPESAEHARYLIALSLPLLISVATVATSRRPFPLAPDTSALAVLGAQLLLVGTLIACYVAQEQRIYGEIYTRGQGEPLFQQRYFTPETLLAAALLAALALAVLHVRRLRELAARLLRETRPRRVLALLAAIAATVVWLLHAVQTDASLTAGAATFRWHMGFTMDETFAVLNGLAPLVDFSSQYGSLWPYVVALPMLAFGKTALVFSLAMCTLTGLALLSIFGVLRRVAGSSLAGLLLFLPFLATSLFMITGTLVERASVGTFYGTFPLRYALPYALAFLTARHIQRGGRPAGVALLFLVGGLAALNNGDFGFAAVGATAAALVWSAAGTRGDVPRLVGAALGGLVGAFALVSLLTLAVAGELPHLGRLVDYARLFTSAGFGMMPVPGLLGLHLAVYLTYVAAIVVATVRALRRSPDRLLTGMLAWAGVFGLGSGTYYIARSHPDTLKHVLSAWTLALALLLVAAAREQLRRPRRWPSIPAAVVCFGFGLAACSLAQTPAPWSQLDRLNGPFQIKEELISPRPLVPSRNPAVRRFVSSVADGPGRFVVRRGMPVAILLPTGHRVADAYGVRNVSEYTGIDSVPTVQRTERVLDALRAAGGNTVILPNPVDSGIFRVLERRGFRLVTHRGLRRYDPSVDHSDAVMPRWPYNYVIKWVDTRHLHAEALR
ncbi:MAG TPA: hypothetical protein VF250_12865 [Conexibacter sp.]